MRILVTTDTLGGVWTYTRELVTGLMRRGIQVVLVSFGNVPEPSQARWMESLSGIDYRPTAFKLEWMQDPQADLIASARYLEDVIEETRPDLLHFSQFYYGALQCGIPRIVVAHSDVMSWWFGVHQKEPPDSSWIREYRKIVRRGIAAATAVVAPSHWMLEQIHGHYGRPAREKVIYNGRSPDLFNPNLRKDDLILSIGRQWDQGKNAALLLRRPMPAPVCIVGADRHPESGKRALSVDRMQTGIRFEGQKSEEELSPLLATASVYAATSCYEPFGLAPVEAALSRCAIVASDIPSFRELWNGVALFFRNDDADSLVRVLEQLLGQHGLIRSYGNLALHRAQQRFTTDAMVEGYMALYQDISRAKALTA